MDTPEPSYDFAAFDILSPSEEGRWFYPRSPKTGAQIPVSKTENMGFLMYGRHSAVARDALRELQDAQAAKLDAGQRITEAEAEAFQAQYLARCTKGWNPFILDGKEMVFTFETARQFYADARFRWLLPGLRDHINAEAVFLSA